MNSRRVVAAAVGAGTLVLSLAACDAELEGDSPEDLIPENGAEDEED